MRAPPPAHSLRRGTRESLPWTTLRPTAVVEGVEMTNVRIGRLRIALAALVAALACLATLAGPAAASDLQATATCNAPMARPFLPWLDPALYAAVPGGSLEADAPAWQLGAGTSLAADNEPWHVGGAGSRSLL